LLQEEEPQAELGPQGVWVLGTEHAAPLLQGLATPPFRLRVLALPPGNAGQVLEAGERVGVVRAEPLAADRIRPFQAGVRGTVTLVLGVEGVWKLLRL
jgi:hypothetical protein